MIARRLVVRGRVQGVGFRYAMIDAVAATGVSGWVRNRRDGSVEAWVQGAVDDVNAAIEWSRRGPPAAQVVAVDVEACAPDLSLARFDMRASA